MSHPGDLAPLLAICEQPTVMVEGGTSYVFLPSTKVVAAGHEQVLDLLLCPGPHSGYTTRLFLSAPIPSRGANWTQWQIFGRTWHTWSWQNVPANLPLIQMVLEHLRILR